MTEAPAVTAVAAIFAHDLSKVYVELSDYRTRAFPVDGITGTIEERVEKFARLMDAAERGEGEPVCTWCREPLGPGAEAFEFCPGAPCGHQAKEHFV